MENNEEEINEEEINEEDEEEIKKRLRKLGYID